MKIKISTPTLLIYVAAMTCLALGAQAKSNYLSQAESQYPNIVGTKLDNCTLCHTSPPTRNAYGSAWSNSSFSGIESLDSDKDGFTNIDEINALTFPGDASDKPTTATAAPSLSSISPTSGPTTGGTSVTLSGANLAGASVSFGGTAVSNAVVNAGGTQITAVAPPHAAGPVSVTATTASGVSSAITYTYVAAASPTPTLGTISPASGTTDGGTSVMLIGTNLTGASVSFGGTAATSAVVDAAGTLITAVTPAHAAGAVGVTATTSSGTSGPVMYTYTAPAPTSPMLSTITPTTGATDGGTVVTLTGTNLTGATVLFGDTPAASAFANIAGTLITAVTPAHAAGAVSVTVATSSGASAPVLYTYAGSISNGPTLAAIGPATGPTAGGTSVTLIGANLTGAIVFFDGLVATSAIVDPTGTMITAMTPAHEAGAVSVIAATASGTSSAVTYTYDAPTPAAPTLSLIAPAVGTTAGGTSVSVR